MKIRTLLFSSALSFLCSDREMVLEHRTQAQLRDESSSFVWDGLRADDVTPEKHAELTSPSLDSGSCSRIDHAVYPTFTMMNSASIATGTYSGCMGFYGNVVYAPRARERTRRESISIFLARRSSRTFGSSKPCGNRTGQLTLVSTMLQRHSQRAVDSGRSASSGRFIQITSEGTSSR